MIARHFRNKETRGRLITIENFVIDTNTAPFNNTRTLKRKAQLKFTFYAITVATNIGPRKDKKDQNPPITTHVQRSFFLRRPLW